MSKPPILVLPCYAVLVDDNKKEMSGRYACVVSFNEDLTGEVDRSLEIKVRKGGTASLVIRCMSNDVQVCDVTLDGRSTVAHVYEGATVSLLRDLRS